MPETLLNQTAILFLSSTPIEVRDNLLKGRWANARLQMPSATMVANENLQMRQFVARTIWDSTGADDREVWANTGTQQIKAFNMKREAYGLGGHCLNCHDNFTHQSMGAPVSLTYSGNKVTATMVGVVLLLRMCMGLVGKLPYKLSIPRAHGISW